MPKNIPLTLACGDYEIVRALKEGEVEPDGIDLTLLTDMDSTTRHWRFIRNRDFDMAETSGSSYIVARDQGMPITALPVFLHRRFRHGFVFINTAKGITKPTDLIGRKIGIKSFLVPAGHWMRGILEHEYGVPHKSIQWFAELDEDIEFTPHTDLKHHPAAARQVGRDHAGRGRARCGDPLQHHQADRRQGPARRAAVAGLQVRGDAPSTRRPASSRSCTCSASSRRSSTAIPGCRSTCSRRSRSPRRSPCAGMKNPRIVPLAWYREAWEEQEEDPRPGPVGIRPDRQEPAHLETDCRLFATSRA